MLDAERKNEIVTRQKGKIVSYTTDPKILFNNTIRDLKVRRSVCGAKVTIHQKCQDPDCGKTIYENYNGSGKSKVVKFTKKYSTTHDTRIHCGINYDACCAVFRYQKTLGRIIDYNIRSKRLYHVVVGFPRLNDIRDLDVKRAYYLMNEFRRDLKKNNIVLNGISVLDIADKTNPYVHLHMAIMPQEGLNFNVEILKKIQRVSEKTKKRLKGEFVFHAVGWRRKDSLFAYFAKRASGLYGGDKKPKQRIPYIDSNGEQRELCYDKTVKDLMSLEEYVRLMYRTKRINKIGKLLTRRQSPEGLGSIVVPIVVRKCPICGSRDLKTSYLIDYTDIFTDLQRLGGKPPPNKKQKDSSIIAYEQSVEDHLQAEIKLVRHFFEEDGIVIV